MKQNMPMKIDKALGYSHKWDFRKDTRLNQDKLSTTDVLNKYPLANINIDYESDYLLYKIPEDFKVLKTENPEEALKFRLATRNIFKQLVNDNNYHIVNCITNKKKGKKEIYYLLEKQK